MNDYLARYEIKSDINKDEYNKGYLNNYLKDSLPFNLFMTFIVVIVGILLIRSKEIVWYRFIFWLVVYLLVILLIDFLTYKVGYKNLLKYSEKNKQICTIYTDRIELQRCDSSNVRIFMYKDAHEISYREDRDRFRFVFSDGKVNVSKKNISKEVFDYLMKLCL